MDNTKICSFCSSAFVVKDVQQIYCNDNCNARAYYHRNKAIIKVRKKKLTDTPEYKKAKNEYYVKHKDRLNKNKINRRNTDPLFKVTCNLRSRLSKAISRKQKNCSAVKDLGCTLDEFRSYIESKFQSGMTWDNYGRSGWHIDHIKPLTTFDLSDEAQIKEACHFTNLQPLWWQDNLKKSGSYE